VHGSDLVRVCHGLSSWPPGPAEPAHP
jgi:hypothetical protein